MREQFWDKIALKSRTPWLFVVAGFILGIGISFVADKVTSNRMSYWTDKLINSQQKVVMAATMQLEGQLEKEYMAELERLQKMANAQAEFTGKNNLPTLDNRPMCLEVQKKGILVGIDPGHLGRTAQGYVNTGAVSINGITEYEFALEVGFLLKEELISRGYDVFMVRESNDRKGYKLTPGDRAIVANEAGCDIVVALHWDSNNDPAHHGYHTIYRDNRQSQSYRLALAISDAYGLAVEGYITKLRRPMKRTDLWQLNWAAQPMTFVELGYASHEGDALWLTDSANHPIMVEGIANGIDNYFAAEAELILSVLPSNTSKHD